MDIHYTFSRPLENLQRDEYDFLRNKRPVEYIAFMVQNGYFHGFYPSFQLIIHRKDLVGNSEVHRLISYQILQGKTSGNYPPFELKDLSKETKLAFEQYVHKS